MISGESVMTLSRPCALWQVGVGRLRARPLRLSGCAGHHVGVNRLKRRKAGKSPASSDGAIAERCEDPKECPRAVAQQDRAPCFLQKFRSRQSGEYGRGGCEFKSRRRTHFRFSATARGYPLNRIRRGESATMAA